MPYRALGETEVDVRRINRRYTLGTLVTFIGIALAGPVVTLALWAVSALAFPGIGPFTHWLYQTVNVWMFSGGFWGTAVRQFWILMVALAAVAVWALADSSDGLNYNTDMRMGPARTLLAVAALVAVIAGVTFTQSVWDDDKDVGRFYGSATEFVVPSLDTVPSPVQAVIDGTNTKGEGNCALTGPAGDDVPMCVTVGDYQNSWESRTASFDGAKYRIKRMSGNVSGTNVNDASITYLNRPEGGVWSAIRDGSGRTVPMDGVIEWDGTNDPTECKFVGDHDLNRAIDGSRGNNLPNLLGERYPKLRFDFDLAWGYCDAGTPVVVFPVTTQQTFLRRVVDVPAGVVTLHGSKDGTPDTTHITAVKEGTFPGPVYPSSTVKHQIAATSWAGGRGVRNQKRFGFEPTTDEAQIGNVDSYLLRSTNDKRLYWVTPLTPIRSDTETFVAYSVTSADTVTAGALNTQRVYVIADGNQTLAVNIAQLAADAKNYVSQVQPGFIAAGGKVVEFVPQSGGTWRGFGEMNGQVIYRLDIDPIGKIAPKLVALDPTTTPPNSTDGGATQGTVNGPSCDNPTDMTAGEIADCITKLSNALQGKLTPLTTGT